MIISSGFTPDQGKLQYYKGVIGNNTSIQLSLELNGDLADGSFIYEVSGEVLVLKGVIGESTQSVMLNVFNDRDVNVAKIQARYYTNDLDRIVAIKGSFLDLVTSKTSQINLKKVAEYVASTSDANSSLHCS